MTEFMGNHYTDDQKAECDAHWAKVRAGQYTADAHVFNDDISHLIDLERFKARKAIEAASAHMRHASRLTEVRS